MAGNDTVVSVGADTTGYVAEIGRAAKSAADFVTGQQRVKTYTENAVKALDSSRQALRAQGDDAVAAFNKSAKQAETFLKSLQKQADQAGKTQAQLQSLRAAELGVAGDAQKYIDQIEKASSATGHLATGSAGARRELLVLAHEASQGNWKNFGGSLMVLGEKIDFMGKVLSPTGLALGAMAAAAYVAYEAIHSLTAQHEELNRTLVLTNNFANLTQGALLAYSQIISKDVGVSTSVASEALMSMAGSGKVAASDLLGVSENIAAYAKFTGTSVQDTAKMFTESYGQAGEAAKKWAEVHHDLSQAQIDYITTLEKSGDKAGAWKEFVLDASSKARAGVIADNNAMAGSYETLGDSWNRFWRTALGKTDDLSKITDRISQLRSLQNDPDSNGYGTQVGGYEDEIKQLEARRQEILNGKQATDDQNKALSTWNSLNQQHIDDMKLTFNWQEKLNEANKTAIDRTNALIDAAKKAGTLTPQLQASLQGDLAKTEAYNATQFKPPKQSNRGYVETKGDSLLDDAQKANAVLKDEVANGEKMNNWASKYAGLQATIDGYEGKTLTKAQESIKAHQAALLPLYQQNAALEQQLEDETNRKKLNADRISLNDKLYNQNDALAAQNQLELYGVTMTNTERQRSLDLLKIETDRQKELAAWAVKASDLKQAGTPADVDEQANINNIYDQRRGNKVKTFNQEDINKGDWVGGATKGLKEITEQTSNLAAIAQSTATGAIQNLGEAVATFATTGKLNIQGFATSLVADFIKIETEALAAQAALSFIKFAGIGSGFATGGLVGAAPAEHFATGGHITGPGTGTSDNIPIMASNGEYIMKASAVSRIGVSNLDAMNNGAEHSVNRLARFASGGLVGPAASVAPRSNDGITINSNLTLDSGTTGGNGLTPGQAASLDQKVKQSIHAAIQKERKQGGVLWNAKNGYN